MTKEPNADDSSKNQKKAASQNIYVKLEPPGKIIAMPRLKTARQLLTALGLEEETALVARNGELLTPDRHIWPDDELLVRITSSHG